MDPMEVFKIEVTGQEEFGAKKYREIIMDILQDLGLIRSIGRLYVYIDIMKPVFAVYGLLRSGIPTSLRSCGPGMGGSEWSSRRGILWS
jgi:hypothetical protein